MDTQSPPSFKKVSLHTLIGSVTISALIGISVILLGNFGNTEVRTLLTSLVISAASLGGVSCGAALDARRARVIPLAGMGLGLLSAMLIIIGIWTDFAEEYWKIAMTLTVFAVACSQMSLLLLARLEHPFVWAHRVGYAIVFGLASFITVLIWGEIEEDPMMRLLGVLAILNGAISIVIPILHRLSQKESDPTRAESRPTLSEIDREISSLRDRLAELERMKDSLQGRWS